MVTGPTGNGPAKRNAGSTRSRKAPFSPTQAASCRTLGSLLYLRAARVQSCPRESVRIPVRHAEEAI